MPPKDLKHTPAPALPPRQPTASPSVFTRSVAPASCRYATDGPEVPVHDVLGTGGPWVLHQTQAARLIEQERLSAWPTGQLMAWAGRRTARWALSQAPHARHVWVAVGPGGNGGDGLHAAAHLAHLGKEVTLTLHTDGRQVLPDTQAALQLALNAGCRLADAPTPGWAELAIDAVLGLGANRPLGGELAAAVRAFNEQPCLRLSIDLPTGLNADSGQALGGGWVKAGSTLSLLTLKPGLFMGVGRDAAGRIWFDPLDSRPLPSPFKPVAQTVTLPVHPRATTDGRRHESHKGRFGDVIVVGGAKGMTGALRLAAHAALAAGAGRVIAAPLDPEVKLEDGTRPECMWRRPEQLQGLPLEQATVVCGCGGAAEVEHWLPDVLARAGRLVIDADALNAVARQEKLQRALHSRRARGLATVLTPHPLEAARLLNCSVEQIQADRIDAALQLSNRFASTTVLKGSGTVVATPRRMPEINLTGNGALATAGTGDVLAGWLAGRWSGSAQMSCPSVDVDQMYSGIESRSDANTKATSESTLAHRVACETVRLHGLAADHHGTAKALLASDLVSRMYSLLR